MKNSDNNKFKSRFGYLMFACGAAIGIGNIWKFPYLAYQGGGGIFIFVYLLVVFIITRPLAEMETTLGRFSRTDSVSAFEKINKRWGFVGWISNAAILLTLFFYVVVCGWCLKYAFQFMFVGSFGEDPSQYFATFVSSTYEPLIWSFIVLIIVLFLLVFGITNFVEKISKIILPGLTILLITTGIYACCINPNSMEGLKYYFLPDFSKFSFKVFADAVTQSLFSIGVGWGAFITLGASVPKENNIRKDTIFLCIADTFIAILAGFTIIPSAYGAGIEVGVGPSLIFNVMTGIFLKLPGGRVFGSFFFLAIVFAAISTLFAYMEIPIKTIENKCKIKRKYAVLIAGGIVAIGNILTSLGYGVLNGAKIPWVSFSGIDWLNFHDWFDRMSSYLLLPLGGILLCIFIAFKWGWKNYEEELTVGNRDGKIHIWNKIVVYALIPICMVIVFLNLFGVIK